MQYKDSLTRYLLVSVMDTCSAALLLHFLGPFIFMQRRGAVYAKTGGHS